jgi:hypothetical protein
MASLPSDLPEPVSGTPFAVTAIHDIVRTIAVVAQRWGSGEQRWSALWDVMSPEASTVGTVVSALRRRLGGPALRLPLPAWLMAAGAMAGDIISRLGWAPPMRTTALQEMRRGVRGDPASWIAATGIEPQSLDAMMLSVPNGVQETWFARLYLLKPLIIGSLVPFWLLSGLIALTIAYDAAVGVLTSRGYPSAFATAVTIVSSLADISVGLAIAFRRTCRAGLVAGIMLSLGYMAGAAVMTPDLWIEPLGALVKTGPAIVLMLVALAVLEDR